MAQITTLKDKDGKTIYPMTSSSAVFDRNGICLDNRLARIVEKEQGKGLSSADFTNDEKQKLSALPTSAELTKQLSAKQVALQSSDEIEVAGSKLSLTEAAKKAVFDDMWLSAGFINGVHYSSIDRENHSDEPYILNRIPCTYDEAMEIYRISAGIIADVMDPTIQRNTLMGSKCKTFFPFMASSQWVNLRQMYSGCNDVEIIQVVANSYIIPETRSTATNYAAFYMCEKLREIHPVLAYFKDDVNCFSGCYSLEEIRLEISGTTVNLKDCSRLSFASVEYMVKHRISHHAIVITVHPDVYAKLTGDTTNSAAAALSDEEAEKWQALVPSAIDKNITFATA